MATDLIEIDPDQPHADAVERAAALIRAGQVVAVPTDALYTLMADPFNLAAVGRVFQAKGRQPQRSLPVLVTGAAMAEELARELSSRFYVLARRFWPGPLTMIVPASAKLPLRVTGNTGRLAMRQSRSGTANAILEALGQPVISTSANISASPPAARALKRSACWTPAWPLCSTAALAVEAAQPPSISRSRTGG